MSRLEDLARWLQARRIGRSGILARGKQGRSQAMQPISSTKVDDCAECISDARRCTMTLDVGSVNSWVNSVMLHKHGPLTGSRQPWLPLDEIAYLRRTVACVKRGDGHRKLDRTDNGTLSHSLNVIHLALSHDHRRPITISGNPLSSAGLWPYELRTHNTRGRREAIPKLPTSKIDLSIRMM